MIFLVEDVSQADATTSSVNLIFGSNNNHIIVQIAVLTIVHVYLRVQQEAVQDVVSSDMVIEPE